MSAGWPFEQCQLDGNLPASDFIAYFGKQPLPFKSFGIIQLFPSQVLRKNDQNWENIGHFWIGNREKIGCKIDQIKSLPANLS